MWSMSKIINTPEVVRVYVGSFWDNDLVFKDNKSMFDKDHKVLMKELEGMA